MLTAQDLHNAFMELGTRAQHEGKVIDLAVYGGSALMLASNFRIATQDVDAVVEGDQSITTRWVAEIAQERQWPRDWLNDAVRTYLSPQVDGLQEHHTLLRAYPSEHTPGLRVFVPSAEYMLAMKLMAMRLDATGAKSDLADILNLLDVVGLYTPEETLHRKDTMPRPSTLAEVARRCNAGEDFSFLLREFLDEFYGALRHDNAAVCIAEEPEPMPDLQEHAVLGAVGEHLARRWNLSIPAWTNNPSRFLRRPYFTTPIEGLKALLIAESPIAFRRRLIFTEAEPLRRARMPRDL